MTAQIINCKEMATSILGAISSRVKRLGIPPRLLVVTVGDDPASAIYVRNKERACEACGIEFHYRKFGTNEVTTDVLCRYLRQFKDDSQFDGIIVQLPLPKHISEEQVKLAIDASLDVDGFHPMSHFEPCTPRGIITLLRCSGYQIAGKHAVIIGRSDIVGKPLARLLLNEDATVTVCHSKTENLEEITRSADILVSAVGKAYFVVPSMVKSGAFVVDVGINLNEEGKVCGDVHPDVLEVAGFLTPVPNGVGRMTVASLMQNVLFSRMNKDMYEQE